MIELHRLINEICTSFPAASSPPSFGPVRNAVYQLAYNEFESDPMKAAEFVLSRVKTWAASPACKKQEPRYRKSLTTWLREESYHTPDECWGVGKVALKDLRESALERIKRQEQEVNRDRAEFPRIRRA